MKHFQRSYGTEGSFEGIKRFIHTGEGDANAFVHTLDEPFALELRKGGRPRRWGHILSAEVRDRGIAARMQFFAGPQVQPLVWRVVIGPNPARLTFDEAKGFLFSYFDIPEGDFHGERREITPMTRIVLPR